MKLREIAHTRAGDKGDSVNIGVIPYDEADYPMLKEKLTAEMVKDYFSETCEGEVKRYELDGIASLNFVLEKSLNGGSTLTLGVDESGRVYGNALLEIEI